MAASASVVVELEVYLLMSVQYVAKLEEELSLRERQRDFSPPPFFLRGRQRDFSPVGRGERQRDRFLPGTWVAGLDGCEFLQDARGYV